MKKQYIALLSAASLAAIAACGGGGGTTTPVVVNPPAPPPSTSTPSATATPKATETPSPTPAPTFTPLPSPSPTATVSPAAAPTYLPDTVQPIFDCVGHSGSSFYMVFGYNNPLSGDETIATGTQENQVLIITSSGSALASPQPQPSTFATGLHDKAFQVPLPTGEVSVQWDLDGNTTGPISKESTSCPTGGGGA